GLAVSLDGRPAPYVAESAYDLQAAAALSVRTRRLGRGRLVARVRDREHHLADPAQQAEPERRGVRTEVQELRSGAHPVPDRVADQLSDDELGIVREVPEPPAGEQLPDELPGGPCLLRRRAQRPAGHRRRLPP